MAAYFTLKQRRSPAQTLVLSQTLKCFGSCNQVEPATLSAATHLLTGAGSYRRLTSQDWPARYHGNKQSSVQSYRYWSSPCGLKIYPLQKKKIFFFFFFLANVHSHSCFSFLFLTLRPQQQHIRYSEPVSGRTRRDTEVFFSGCSVGVAEKFSLRGPSAVT